MRDAIKFVWLGLYSSFFGVLFTSAFAFSVELSELGLALAKIYALTTGLMWLLATFRWSL